ncbi:MAG: hypothetical protein IPL65_21980 [Lewinellaceae bacterium]|nr:hypothetical protein [Lewinellaceae bacterium]
MNYGVFHQNVSFELVFRNSRMESRSLKDKFPAWVSEADKPFVTVSLQSGFGTDMEEFHGFPVIDPFFMLTPVLILKAVHDLFHQSVERFGLKADNIEAVSEFGHLSDGKKWLICYPLLPTSRIFDFLHIY